MGVEPWEKRAGFMHDPQSPRQPFKPEQICGIWGLLAVMN
jgi:hypothetical protein